MSDPRSAGDNRGSRRSRARSVHVDFTSDPLAWPSLEGAPATDAEWAIEYAVIAERMREEPQSWPAKRWPLPELASDPPPDFRRRFVTLWLYAPLPHVEGQPVDLNRYILQRMDALLSGERNRQIRERLRASSTATSAAPPVEVVRPELQVVGAPNLPGALTWSSIEAAYRRLAAESPTAQFRRKKTDQPSRPEVAKALNVSPATLKRACVATGEGPRWPPSGL